MQKYAPCIPQKSYPGSMCERSDGEYYLASDVDAALLKIFNARLDWAMVCNCDCKACQEFYDLIRSIDDPETP